MRGQAERPRVLPPMVWAVDAACRGTDPAMWFPSDLAAHLRPAALRDARDICSGCPVAVQCGRWAAEAGEAAGIWAGRDLSPRYEQQRCGTSAGWRRHRDRSQEPCGPCTEARNVLQRTVRAAAPVRRVVSPERPELIGAGDGAGGWLECRRGHPLTPYNTSWQRAEQSGGVDVWQPRCRTCDRERARAARERRP